MGGDKSKERQKIMKFVDSYCKLLYVWYKMKENAELLVNDKFKFLKSLLFKSYDFFKNLLIKLDQILQSPPLMNFKIILIILNIL